MAFKDLAEAIDVREPIVLPVMGEAVEFPGTISARAGMILMAVISAARVSLAEEDDASTAAVLAAGSISEADAAYLEAQLLGDVADRLDELVEYNGRRRALITNTLIVWHSQGAGEAEVYWNAGGELGKALTNRATRRKAGRSSKTDGGEQPPSKAQRPRAPQAGDSSRPASPAKPTKTRAGLPTPA